MPRLLPLPLPLLALLLSVPAGAQRPAPHTGNDVLAAMHDRYAATWYRTLTFVQRSIWYDPRGAESRVETWHEALATPGLLRIDRGAAAARTGAIYRADSTYSFRSGKLTAATAGRNPLLILGFDVYAQPAARTAAVLREEGFDLTAMHRDTFEGRPVYVVGAAAGDTLSKQFWVDAERLLFVRLLQPGRPGSTGQDIRFNRYVREPGGWLAEQVRVLVGGKRVYEEDYSDVRVNVKLNPDLWKPQAWASVPLWWR